MTSRVVITVGRYYRHLICSFRPRGPQWESNNVTKTFLTECSRKRKMERVCLHRRCARIVQPYSPDGANVYHTSFHAPTCLPITTSRSVHRLCSARGYGQHRPRTPLRPQQWATAMLCMRRCGLNTGEGEKRKEGKRLEKRRACELGRGRSVSQFPLLPRVNDSELLRTSASTVHTHIAVYNANVTRIKTENYSQCKR